MMTVSMLPQNIVIVERLDRYIENQDIAKRISDYLDLAKNGVQIEKKVVIALHHNKRYVALDGNKLLLAARMLNIQIDCIFLEDDNDFFSFQGNFDIALYNSRLISNEIIRNKVLKEECLDFLHKPNSQESKSGEEFYNCAEFDYDKDSRMKQLFEIELGYSNLHFDRKFLEYRLNR